MVRVQLGACPGTHMGHQDSLAWCPGSDHEGSWRKRMAEQPAELTERTEVLMAPDMKDWIKVAAKSQGLNPSSWLRMLAARELTSKYGSGWQDHPGGDLEQDAEVTVISGR